MSRAHTGGIMNYSISTKRTYFTTFQLKMTAVILMVIDHLGEFFPEFPVWFRYIGRISAPLFFFCMAWGMDYTRSRSRYLLRLYAASAAMEGVWILLQAITGTSTDMHNNIFTTLFISGGLICLAESVKERRVSGRKAGIIIAAWLVFSIFLMVVLDFLPAGSVQYAILNLMGNPFTCEGGVFWIVLGILLYYGKKSRKRLACVYTLVCALYALNSMTVPIVRGMYFITAHTDIDSTFIWEVVEIIYSLVFGTQWQMTEIVPHGLYLGDYQWMMIGALPFMLLYNQRPGRKCRLFFYIFYPLHIAVFFIISVWM